MWNRDSFVWDKVTLTWAEAFVMEVLDEGYKGGAPGILLDEDRPWKSLDDDLEENGVSEEVRDKLLEIIVKVNGLDKKVSRLSESKNPTVTVEHVKKTISASGREVKVMTGSYSFW